MRNQDPLRRRLSRLSGPKRSPSKSVDLPSQVAVELVDGQTIETAHGPVFWIEKEYPIHQIHGAHKISAPLEFPPGLTAEVARDPSLCEVDPENLIFIDTETTGLVGGAGTVAFLIGLGTYTGGSFRIRQFFLRNPGEEHSMLRVLQDEFQTRLGFVSFNGRTFDLPLLDMRFRIGLRESLKLSRRPQMDLLHPARRLWRRKLPDCSLGTIEREILGVQRTDQDVPGAQIPGMYLDYLRTGNIDGIQRVIYHNEIDILSMVSLTAEILSQHQSAEFQQDAGAEALGVAGWHLGAGRLEAAEAAYLAAVESPDLEIRIEALRRISGHLKRTGRRSQAVEYWISWHELAPEDPRPCIELAMFYEWEVRDLEEAKTWAQNALVCLSHWPEDWRREKAWSEITHRLSRLDRKLNR